MTDDFGVPDNTFGLVEERFYGAVGRVVMLSAVAELRLLDLCTALTGAEQGEHDGKNPTELLEASRAALPGFIGDFAAKTESVLEQLRLLLEDRNAVVHSLWPSPATDDAWGWRPVRKTRRTEAENPYREITLQKGDLPDLILGLVAVVAALAERLNLVHAERLSSAAPGPS